jgi:hypothetical protein
MDGSSRIVIIIFNRTPSYDYIQSDILCLVKFIMSLNNRNI